MPFGPGDKLLASWCGCGFCESKWNGNVDDVDERFDDPSVIVDPDRVITVPVSLIVPFLSGK